MVVVHLDVACVGGGGIGCSGGIWCAIDLPVCLLHMMLRLLIKWNTKKPYHWLLIDEMDDECGL